MNTGSSTNGSSSVESTRGDSHGANHMVPDDLDEEALLAHFEQVGTQDKADADPDDER